MEKKTLKREYAFVLFLFLCYHMTPWGNLQVLELILMPVLTYIAAVSGLHIWKDKRSEASK